MFSSASSRCLSAPYVIRLLNKQSSLGCFDKLYQGVEQLDEKYFATAACRLMLTNPVNSSRAKCQELKIKIDEIGVLYTCLNNSCFRRSFSYYSGLKCRCGGDINKAVSYDLNLDYANYEEFYGFFIEGANKFVVTDALLVEPIEYSMLSIAGRCGDWSGLEERCIRIERAQVLHILKRSIISDTPLTDVLLCNGGDVSPKFSVPPPVETTVAIKAFDPKIYRITLALLGNKVLYAGTSRDFVDEIFSFLTFPLGTLRKQLGSRCRIGCLNNLYDSASKLGTLGYMVTGYDERLVNPKLPPYFNCDIRFLGVEVEEEVYYACNYRGRPSAERYSSCYTIGHLGEEEKRALLIDPKTSPFSYGSFCKELMYMVSDELVVTPFSFTSVFSLHRQTSEPIKMVELGIGEEEVLDLLSAASSSKAALTDALFARANGVLTSVDGKAE